MHPCALPNGQDYKLQLHLLKSLEQNSIGHEAQIELLVSCHIISPQLKNQIWTPLFLVSCFCFVFLSYMYGQRDTQYNGGHNLCFKYSIFLLQHFLIYTLNEYGLQATLYTCLQPSAFCLLLQQGFLLRKFHVHWSKMSLQIK